MKEIPLTQGKVALVDDEDYARVMQYKWCAHRTDTKNTTTWYATRSKRVDGRKVYTLMHRFILNAPAGMVVDHKDFDGLNNQRINIRLCTRSQNAAHKRAWHSQSSVFRGVRPQHGKWGVRIIVKGVPLFIGLFATEKGAAIAYNEVATKHFGSFALLNLVDGD